ncbi:MAG: GNAT family N-acetyltransferase [Bacteroidales bacterium]|nr:GNAT family N-acetyltransferase [Bacteroidales bacterium]
MNILLIKKDLPDIEKLRYKYLQTLSQFQEIYLELMITDANIYGLQYNNNQVGYCIITKGHIIVEFYVDKEYFPISSNLLSYAVKELSAQSIYCKSFDSLLLNSSIKLGYPLSIIGIIYRDSVEADITINPQLDIKLANQDDVPLILQQDDDLVELYDTKKLLNHFIDNKNLYLFRKDNQLLGCGTIIRVHKKWPHHDIGVWVHPSYRKQGYASQIVTYLKNYCLAKSYIPTCSCDINNIASQKTLQKCGYRSQHSLIEFKTT